jgi:hypothetical protein
VNWYCQECQRFVGAEPGTEHDGHKQRIVGIRDDILKDAIKRLIFELRVTDRLVEFKT